MNDREQERLVEEFDLEPDTWDDFERAEKTAFLAAIMRPGESDAEAAASLEELERLADTAGTDYRGRRQRFGHAPPTRMQFGGVGMDGQLARSHDGPGHIHTLGAGRPLQHLSLIHI